ncbi:unnamed protein product (macronuclear) [Paramecium tetraurelia]|uniref:Uncharacterized protein n=1 Tax=Paramecium tetraurelia TaxID=5888 RepID=A0DD38_PARTE|nr:uncharacterized protein GSPATT00015814001 [Paramecium tetraurelia]CAK80955.1 unnamed protein product [Paramecium tetraurelia]|eukprot:XP_001448352.1 hypothetical protein (macronuclear) [Paramecium tetraurelia strain d4-2]
MKSDIKLPLLDHQPLKLNPSYKLKFQNPLRIQYMRFLDKSDLKETETFYMKNYAKAYNIPILCTYRGLIPKQKEEKKKALYKRPNYKYFKEEDSDLEGDQVQRILSMKQSQKQKKLFVSE